MAQETIARCGVKRTVKIHDARLEIDIQCNVDMLERPGHEGKSNDLHSATDYQDGVYIIYRWASK